MSSFHFHSQRPTMANAQQHIQHTYEKRSFRVVFDTFYVYLRSSSLTCLPDKERVAADTNIYVMYVCRFFFSCVLCLSYCVCSLRTVVSSRELGFLFSFLFLQYFPLFYGTLDLCNGTTDDYTDMVDCNVQAFKISSPFFSMHVYARIRNV